MREPCAKSMMTDARDTESRSSCWHLQGNYHVFITAIWTLEDRKLVLAIVAGI